MSEFNINEIKLEGVETFDKSIEAALTLFFISPQNNGNKEQLKERVIEAAKGLLSENMSKQYEIIKNYEEASEDDQRLIQDMDKTITKLKRKSELYDKIIEETSRRDDENNSTKAKRSLSSFVYNIKFKLRMRKVAKQYPNAGFYERILLANHYSPETIDQMVESHIKDGYISDNSQQSRETVCHDEISYWD